jgi:hypothetical protein
VDIRIGVTYSPREIDLQLPEDADQDQIQEDVEAAMGKEKKLLWVTDKRGRKVGVPSDKIAYVEIGADAESRSIGFGA